MYDWRKMSPKQQQRVFAKRKYHGLSWHWPPHRNLDGRRQYLISAACYEHAMIVGIGPERMIECEERVLEACRPHSVCIHAWCILPNHYHVLLETACIKALLAELGRFHGRSSRRWNLEDAQTGRKVWHGCVDRPMESERHFWASMNYVHNNPVRHGYVKKWQDWPFSSARSYLGAVGRKKAEEIWRAYPVLDYGKDWDV